MPQKENTVAIVVLSKRLLLLAPTRVPALPDVFLSPEQLESEIRKFNQKPKVLRVFDGRPSLVDDKRLERTTYFRSNKKETEKGLVGDIITESEEASPLSTSEEAESQLHDSEEEGKRPRLDQLTDKEVKKWHRWYGHCGARRLRKALEVNQSKKVTMRTCARVCKKYKTCNYVRRSYPRPWKSSEIPKIEDEYEVNPFESVSIDLLYLYRRYIKTKKHK